MGTERETPAPPELRRELAKWAFWGTIIAALIGAASAIAAAGITIIPRLPPKEYIYTAQVPASSVRTFVKTSAILEPGDDVQIIVQGDDAYWNCGKGDIGPGGILGDRWIKTVAPSANQCELVGYILEGVPFRVGAYKQFKAAECGSLYLGANDDRDQASDNSGTLIVKIIVTRKR